MMQIRYYKCAGTKMHKCSGHRTEKIPSIYSSLGDQALLCPADFMNLYLM